MYAHEYAQIQTYAFAYLCTHPKHSYLRMTLHACLPALFDVSLSTHASSRASHVGVHMSTIMRTSAHTCMGPPAFSSRRGVRNMHRRCGNICMDRCLSLEMGVAGVEVGTEASVLTADDTLCRSKSAPARSGAGHRAGPSAGRN